MGDPMDKTTKELVLRILAGFVRSFIIAAGAWLKATGKLPAIEIDSWVGQLAGMAPQIAGDLLMLVGLAWSALQKDLTHRNR
jgi:hypothetical protein